MQLRLVLFVNCLGLVASVPDPRYVSYDELMVDVDRFSEPGITDYGPLVFDPTRFQVIVGARNRLLRLTLEGLTKLEEADLSPSEEGRELCTRKGQTGEDCNNFLRVLLLHGKKLFACGTNAFAPSCSWRKLEGVGTVLEEVDGVGKAPHGPRSNVTSLMTSTGELYSGTPVDFAGQDAAIYRMMGGDRMLRTKQYNPKWLSEPDFVYSFETDHHVYFLFREDALEFQNCAQSRQSRIARVCKRDTGGKLMLQDNWTSFRKALLNCSLPGRVPFVFPDVVSAAFDARENVLYALFSTPENSIPGSAVCAFRMADVEDAFRGDFQSQPFHNAMWTRVDRTGTGPDDDCRANELQAERYQLLADAVQPRDGRPLLFQHMQRWQRLGLDRVRTKSPDGVTVLYVGSAEGEIRKVSLPAKGEPCLIETLQLFPSRADRQVLSFLHVLPETASFYVGTARQVLRIPAHRCHRWRTEESCLAASDPYCGWDLERQECAPPPDGDPSAPFWEQNPPKRCPRSDALPVDGGWSKWSPWEPCSRMEEGESHASIFHPFRASDEPRKCLCRVRDCSRPTPVNGGRSCSGESAQVTNCTVDGGWTDWSAWSACSASCGFALKWRRRTCTNPQPRFGGKACEGKDTEEAMCTDNPPCPTIDAIDWVVIDDGASFFVQHCHTERGLGASGVSLHHVHTHAEEGSRCGHAPAVGSTIRYWTAVRSSALGVTPNISCATPNRALSSRRRVHGQNGDLLHRIWNAGFASPARPRSHHPTPSKYLMSIGRIATATSVMLANRAKGLEMQDGHPGRSGLAASGLAKRDRRYGGGSVLETVIPLSPPTKPGPALELLVEVRYCYIPPSPTLPPFFFYYLHFYYAVRSKSTAGSGSELAAGPLIAACIISFFVGTILAALFLLWFLKRRKPSLALVSSPLYMSSTGGSSQCKATPNHYVTVTPEMRLKRTGSYTEFPMKEYDTATINKRNSHSHTSATAHLRLPLQPSSDDLY
ncbi:unnamed protein product [Darwinula stevensoni]|uniref:Sema domain-containing protein n=1 Tax=Darwinula stevensoni TaxID=69355 RepID=A0A7R8XDZ5_9CRUS|nr:unnamed protein product [Darwinula stevensoni]CAG0890106.1 unnamed protein product [Darwinula stevensoni]